MTGVPRTGSLHFMKIQFPLVSVKEILCASYMPQIATIEAKTTWVPTKKDVIPSIIIHNHNTT